MDGYIRANTDENGKIIDIWDEWYKDSKTEGYIRECGIICYLQQYSFTPISLVLITFKHKSEITESYMYGKECDDWVEIENEIVLIDNYNYEDIKECEDSKEIENTLSKWNDEI